MIFKIKLKNIIFISYIFLDIGYSYCQNLSPKSLSMADAFAANYSPWAIFSNPSGISKQKNIWIGLSYQDRFLIKELSNKSICLIFPLDRNVFAFSFNNFGYEYYSENTFSLYYATNLLENLSTSINFNLFILNDIAKLTFDIGTIIQIIDYLNLGIYVVNMISQLTYKEFLDSYMKVALSYTKVKNTNLVLEVQPYLFINKFIYKLGIEYNIFKSFLINFGISNHFSMFSLGIESYYDSISFIFSLSYHNKLNLSPSFSVDYKFD